MGLNQVLSEMEGLPGPLKKKKKLYIFFFHVPSASDYSPNLSILLSEGKENNNDPVTNGERTPDSP